MLMTQHVTMLLVLHSSVPIAPSVGRVGRRLQLLGSMEEVQQMQNSTRLAGLLESRDCEDLRDLFHAFFAGIPNEWHTNN